jgi:hypothetical protein
MKKTKIGFIHEVARFISDITGLPSNEVSNNYLNQIKACEGGMFFSYQGNSVKMGITITGDYFAEITKG